MAYILITAGVLLIVAGVLMLNNPQQQTATQEHVPATTNIQASTAQNNLEEQSSSENLSHSESVPEQQSPSQTETSPTAQQTEADENVQKGREFEQYVIDHFNRKYFSLKEWRSDKMHNGVYAESNRYPDMEWEFMLHDTTIRFAVECKWRNDFYNKILNWCTQEQLQVYKQFQTDRNIPVFIIIGIGGEPSAPSSVHIVPLRCMKYNDVTREYLQQFPFDTTHRNFYFDINASTLEFYKKATRK